MKKILFTGYSLRMGGIEKCLVNLVNNLDSNKYDITVILQVKEGQFDKELNKNIHLKYYGLTSNKNIIIKKIVNTYKYLKLLLTSYHKYDLSVCYFHGYKPSAILALISSKNNACYLHTNILNYMTNFDWKDLHSKYDNPIDRAKYFINYMYFRKFKKNIFVSNDALKAYLSIYPSDKSKALVIHNLIDYKDMISKSSDNIDLIDIKNKPIFLNVGRHTEEDKRLTRIINATDKLKKDYKFTVLFVGDGKDHEKYIDLVNELKLNDYIKFLGKKDNPYPYYKLCDAFILSSSFEGYPTTFLESMVFNKPIITTNVSDALCDIDKQYGIVVDNNDESIYFGIKKYLDEGFKTNKKFDMEEYNKKSISQLEDLL